MTGKKDAKNGHSVLVVGASSTVGQAVVDAFARDDASILATYTRNPIADKPPSMQSCMLDLSVDQVAAGVQRVMQVAVAKSECQM